jgi:hypothetical protein
VTVLAANGLQGTDGVAVTSTTLTATGDAPLDIFPADLEYDDTHPIRGRNSIRMRTLYTRNDSGRFAYALPAGGPWGVRFYVNNDPLTNPFDINDYRYLFRIGDHAIVMRESSGRNVVMRLQNHLDLSVAPVQGTESGSAQVFDQVLRVEITYSAGVLTSRVYTGNNTGSFRQNQWNVNLGSVDRFTVSSYRLYRFPLLQVGDTDASTGGLVTPFQQRLLIWDPNSLPQFGADGDYGGETVSAVSGFQSEFGITVDGQAGPETQTALDLLVRLDADPDDYPVPYWIGNLVVTDTADPIGPLDPYAVDDLTAPVAVSAEVEAEETTVSAIGAVGVSATVDVSASVGVDLEAGVGVGHEESLFTKVDVDLLTGVGVSTEMHIEGESLIPDPPLAPPQWELAVYDPNGDLRGILPYPLSWTASVPLDDVGTMTLEVAAGAPGTHLLSAPFEIALRLRRSDSDDFVEPPGCRFISLARRRNWQDRTTRFTWMLANYSWMLRKDRLTLPSPSGVFDVERTFTSQRAGAILNTLASESPMRFGGISRTFSATQDSNGQPWQDSQTITYPYGVDYLTVVQTFAEEGILHWRFNQRSWEAFRADLPVHDATSSVLIPAERGVLEINDMLSFEDFCDRVQFIYQVPFTDSEGETRYRTARGVRTSSLSPKWWGRWTDLLSTPGKVTSAAASTVAGAYLSLTNVQRFQNDRRLAVLAHQPVPLLDYNAGSMVQVEDADERDYTELAPEQISGVQNWTIRTSRVEQITLTAGADRAMEAVVSLDGLFKTRDVLVSKLLKRMNGTSNAVWGAGSILPF